MAKVKKLPKSILINATHIMSGVCIDAHVDPAYRDVVISGYGYRLKDVKKLSKWLDKAIKYLEGK